MDAIEQSACDVDCDLGQDAQYALFGYAAASIAYILRRGWGRSCSRATRLLRGAHYDGHSTRICGIPAWAAFFLAVVLMCNRLEQCGFFNPEIDHPVANCLRKLWECIRPGQPGTSTRAPAAAEPPGNPTSNVYIIHADTGDKSVLPESTSTMAISALARFVGILTGTTAAQQNEIEEIKASLRTGGVLGQMASVRVDMTKLSKQQENMKQAQYMDTIKTIITKATAGSDHSLLT